MSYVRPLPPDVLAAVRTDPGRLISRRTLLELGHGSTTISGWTGAGLLERLLPTQYRVADDAVPLWQGVRATWGYLTDRRPGSPVRISGQAGLKAGGIDVDLPPCVTCVVDAGRRVRLRTDRFVTVQRGGLGELPSITRYGMSFLPPHLCLVHLLAERTVTDDQLRKVLYAIVNRSRTTPAQMAADWRDLFRPQQVSRLLFLVADGSLQHESPAERSTFLDLFTDHPPAPDCQVWMTPRIRVDYAYLFAALVLEYHGETSHRDRVDSDATRIHELAELGIETLVITRSMRRDPVGLTTHIHQRRRLREQLFLEGRLPRPPLPVQPDRLLPLRTLHPGC